VSRRIHLIAPAGSLGSYLEDIEFRSVHALLDLAQTSVGSDYQITANLNVLDAVEDEDRGGRLDDAERARDIENALADDDVAAIVALRGGAWLTRILPRIRFGVLDRRTRPVAMIGFSELTTLVNIVGAHPNGLGVYELSPAFLSYGLKRATTVDPHPDTLRRESGGFFEHLVAMIEGRRSIGPIEAALVRGEMPDDRTATFVGGNLTVFSTLVGSVFAESIDPAGRWIMLEDFNDKPERFDRLLAHLTLARFWDRCAGVLLGDFHFGYRDLQDVMIAMLGCHLPDDRNIPVLTTRQIGHVWPMTPLPLCRLLRVTRQGDTMFNIHWSEDTTRVI